MREFEYYLFAGFDAEREAENPGNPRNFLGAETDAVLSLIAGQPAYACGHAACAGKFGPELIGRMVEGGVLRREGATLTFDCPVFLREDAAALRRETASKAARLADMLDIPRIRRCCEKVKNGFPVEINLYHLLCCDVFDGLFFDYLRDKGALATSRRHPSGLDYLNVIYEKCGELEGLSQVLLCSCNSLRNEECSLQSFGDANGSRLDFYRFFRMMEKRSVPGELADVETALREGGFMNKDALLREMLSLIRTGRCDEGAARLFERFGYARGGELRVPVYMPGDLKAAEELEAIMEETLGDDMAKALKELAGTLDITAARHGVDRSEIANELYHILFGSINEELILRGIAAGPRNIPGEGRYFKCVEVYG